MKTHRNKLRIVITTLFLSLLVACAVVPITGRKQLSLISEQEMIGMSLTSYKQFLSENKISNNQTATAMVKRVGNRIATAVTKFLKDKGMEERIKDYQWEFNLVDENVPNAWCMPGGKVVVYTGLLPLTKD
jgi:predicted Zn-dependent protease